MHVRKRADISSERNFIPSKKIPRHVLLIFHQNYSSSRFTWHSLRENFKRWIWTYLVEKNVWKFHPLSSRNFTNPRYLSFGTKPHTTRTQQWVTKSSIVSAPMEQKKAMITEAKCSHVNRIVVSWLLLVRYLIRLVTRENERASSCSLNNVAEVIFGDEFED